MSRNVVLVTVVGTLAGFAGGWAAARTAAPTSDETRADAARPADERNSVAEELTRLASKIDRLDAAVRAMQQVSPSVATAPPRVDVPTTAVGASATPLTDPYAAWTDDELSLVALRKGDDLNLFKAALRRPLPAERRVKVLLSMARYYEKLESWGQPQRDALSEAVGISSPNTPDGGQAALDYAAALTHVPSEKWRGTAYFESVLRDGPTEELRMKGAYGLAWRHDCGDEPEVALAEFKKFLAEYGEKWTVTTEVNWARQRIALLESAK